MSIEDKLIAIAANESRVYEAGKKSEYDTFWDITQDYGNRKNYAFAFSSDMWTQENFKPKYPIRPIGAANNAFAYWGQDDFLDKKVDLREVCTFDLSACTTINSMFYLNRCVVAIGVLDLRNINAFETVFSGATYLETIEKIILKNDGTQTFSNFLRNCDELKNLKIEGVIGQNGFTVQQSTKLSKASWISIINALSTTTSGLSITGSLASVKKAFETSEDANDGNTSPEWLALTATKSNWTISLV